MPAELTKAKIKRRNSRKDFDEYRFDGSHARELELKRNRGAVSCAECRRLKIKCDKQIPCQSCQRRGCAALCPNGSLSTGQGTRFVLAATEHLHRRISHLSGRIRQLEDALASLQAQHSSEPHPLLHEDLLVHDDTEEHPTGDDAMNGGGLGGGGTGAISAPDVIDAFGTLSISDHGISRFFGPTGGSESLLIANLNASTPVTPQTPESMRGSSSPSDVNKNGSSLSTNPSSTHLPPALQPPHADLSLFSHSFPFTPLGLPPDVQRLITSHLPPLPAARYLCRTYFDQVSWLFRGVTRAQLMGDMISSIYGVEGDGYGGVSHDDLTGVGATEDYSGPHDLALLFMVFAIGALVMPEEPGALDGLDLPPGLATVASKTTAQTRNALGEHYHQVARAAIALQPVLEKPSIVTIQTLHLMSVYNAMSGSDLKSETSMEMTWSLITLAGHLSMTIGLHRDSARWGLSPKMVQRRRILFWDLFVADVWQSLNTGRPPSFSLAYIDCSFPQPEEGGKGEGAEGGFGSAFGIWQCRFAAECVADVTARTLTAEAPSYATIMELDRKVREFPLPEGSAGAASDDLAVSFQLCVLDHIRETVLMYIHRSFFAQAIIEYPVNPLKSPYAPSFLAAYRASSTILKSVREQFNIWPNSCSRFWTMWTFAFSAALPDATAHVVFGTVVTRGPRSPLAQSAMSELEQACVLFKKASVYSIRATKALPILMKLNEKARYALAAAQKDPTPVSGDNGGLLWNIKQEDTDDELSIFAGHTRFVSGKRTTAQPEVTTNTNYYPPPAQQVIPAPTPAQQYRVSAPHPGPEPSQSIHSWVPPANNREGYMTLPRLEEIEAPIQYQYVPSERTHQLEAPASYGWSNEAPRPTIPPTPQQYRSLEPPPAPMQYSTGNMEHFVPRPPPPMSASVSQQSRQHHNQLTHQQHLHQREQLHHLHPHPPQPQSHSQQYFQPHQQQPNPHLQHHPDSYHQHPQYQHHYATTPAFQSNGPPPNAELSDLGLAARDSRLDERWSSFMEDSGLLEGITFRG
ncbi:fungal-specific transcription factor domain-containing protein [Collybia nuda]|uniref:Fungal-specific transcription factor domain-containing protein n=1 Tax=Collybia nuda TaxID=64659 RepID=A0A9P5XWX1_9AGAR|nr:fungal-specific transcription factor domain-containing protein [Collybia nuda]